MSHWDYMAVACIVNNDMPGLQKILAHEGIDTHENDYYDTPLMFATRAGNVEFMKPLIDYGWSVHSRSRKEGYFYQNNCLHFAARFNRYEAAKLILQHHPDIAARNYEGDAALHLAAKNGSLPIVKLLLDYGADVNQPGRHNIPPILAALNGGGDAELALFLLDHGADAQAHDDFNESVLHKAAQKDWDPNATRLIKRLLSLGADPSLKETDGFTPFDYALQAGAAANAALLGKARIRKFFHLR